MAVKPASEMAVSTKEFLARAKDALDKLQAFHHRLTNDLDFQELWNRDSAEALRSVGIDPDSRMEMGLGPYDEAARDGLQCNMCITPGGNVCHC